MPSTSPAHPTTAHEAIGEEGSLKVSLTTSDRRVSYFYDPDVGSYYYGSGHPMKPQRMRMTHSLILAYGIYSHLTVYRPHKALESELTNFHDATYINFMAELGGVHWEKYRDQMKVFNVGDVADCPVFDGLYPFQRSCAGASIDAATRLNHKETDIAINWSGGLHHAKRAEASGFCYINDIVLGILELLKYHNRVLYIDIDIHHGDGVEEAFMSTHRVMTVSFHRFGDFFPGTGNIKDIGAASGRGYTVNVPLDDGVDDHTFLDLYRFVISRVVQLYNPGAIVIQCGADSVAGDRLGRFNVSIAGHAACVEYVRSFHIPLMVLGGGGYTIRNVARTWLYETAVCLNKHYDISDIIPDNEYSGYYGPENKLHLPLLPIGNKNHPEVIASLKIQIAENLRNLSHVPSVDFNYVPPDFMDSSVVDQDEVDSYLMAIGLERALDENDRMESVAHLTSNQEHAPTEDDEEPPKNQRTTRSKTDRYSKAATSTSRELL